MPNTACYWRVAAISLFLSLMVWLALCIGGRNRASLTVGFLVGAGVCLLAQWLFFQAWRAAPDKMRVTVFYLLRAAVIFGSIAAALFLPQADALGVLVPQLFPVPVLAVFLLLPGRKIHTIEERKNRFKN